MEEDNINLPTESTREVKDPRQLVEDTFKELGFNNENPDDLDMVTELLNIWRNPDFDDTDPDFEYTPEQYMLLNDPDVQNVLNKCKSYYEPKRHLSKGDLRTILEQIAQGKLTRQDYDFKNGSAITVEPSFQERIAAIKMLQESADDDNKAATVQFVNNIITTDPQHLPVKPNLEAPKEPPADHYSLKLQEPTPDSNSSQIGEEDS